MKQWLLHAQGRRDACGWPAGQEGWALVVLAARPCSLTLGRQAGQGKARMDGHMALNRSFVYRLLHRVMNAVSWGTCPAFKAVCLVTKALDLTVCCCCCDGR